MEAVMPSTEFFGITAGLLSLVALIYYVNQIVSGKESPSRSAWWIFTLVGFMLLISYKASGATDTIWVPIFNVVGPLTVALLSIKYGKSWKEKGWSRLDTICVLGAVASAIIWWLTDSPLVALLMNLGIDFLGIVPIVRDAWKRPTMSAAIYWGITYAGILLNLFAVSPWSFELAIYPLYMVITGGAIIAVFLSRLWKTT